MRRMHSPVSSFIMAPGRQSPQELFARSQSTSLRSNGLRKSQEDTIQQRMRQLQIKEALVQIDCIYSSLMTPAQRKNKCLCGSNSTCSVHCNQTNKTPKSENNFTSFIDSRARSHCNQNKVLCTDENTSSHNQGDSNRNKPDDSLLQKQVVGPALDCPA